MKKIYVALITPFTTNNDIDYRALETIVIRLMQEGCDGFIVCGTTGESCTLQEEEKFSILSRVLNITQGRVDVYFGCGSNDTYETLRMCRRAQNYPINGLLIVTPYYNKPSQEGLYAHYACIASNCTLPIIMYQVEARCNVCFSIETLQRLVHSYPTIVALKYASNNLEQARMIRLHVPSLTLYNGDDSLILEGNNIAMDGVISVVGHIAMRELQKFYFEEDYLYDYYFKRLSALLFVESNPSGIKYVLSLRNEISYILRLPLASLTQRNKQLLNAYFDINIR